MDIVDTVGLYLLWSQLAVTSTVVSVSVYIVMSVLCLVHYTYPTYSIKLYAQHKHQGISFNRYNGGTKIPGTNRKNEMICVITKASFILIFT